MSEDDKELIRIVKLDAYGVSHRQIAEVLGVTEGRISQLINTERYQQLLGQFKAEHIEQNESFNSTWDAIEARAMDNLYREVEYNKDPDLNLKVAVMANKARRRGGGLNGANANLPLEGSSSMRTIIHLPITFVQNLQEAGGQLQVVKTQQDRANKVNFMDPTKVQKLLANKEDQIGVPDLLPGFKKVAAE